MDEHQLYKILCILPYSINRENRKNDFLVKLPFRNNLFLATYGIIHPQIQWSEIPSTIEITEEVLNNSICLNINETNKEELLHQIETYQPNIIVFAGTFKEFETSEMEKIGWNINYTAKRYVNDDQLGNTTAFYITSPTRLCIEAFSPDDYRMSDKTYWYEMKKAVELWEEFR